MDERVAKMHGLAVRLNSRTDSTQHQLPFGRDMLAFVMLSGDENNCIIALYAQMPICADLRILILKRIISSSAGSLV